MKERHPKKTKRLKYRVAFGNDTFKAELRFKVSYIQ